jgi:hypothetical protein
LQNVLKIANVHLYFSQIFVGYTSGHPSKGRGGNGLWQGNRGQGRRMTGRGGRDGIGNREGRKKEGEGEVHGSGGMDREK